MRKALSIIIALLGVVTLNAQTPTDSAAMRALLVGRALPQERVYLHFDNTTYYLGETMWFKAFVTSHGDDRITNHSRVLYVELVAPEGYVVKTEKYKIADDGTCFGEIYLDPAYLSGFFEVRAYTRYMLNWGDEAIFSRVFPVYDKLNNADWEFRNMLDRPRSFRTKNDWIDPELPECTLTFYPEGGHLVTGLKSTVAYELHGIDGIGGDSEITILADGKRLLTTTPQHQGKGTFTLTPQKGVEYTATVTMKNSKGKNKKHTFELPTVEEEGVILAVTNTNGTIGITISDNYTTSTALGFAVLHRSSIGFYRHLPGGTSTITMQADSLPEGVCRAVVFSGDVPLAERIFFVRHDSLQAGDRQTVKLRVTANGDAPHKLDLRPHGKITLTVEREDGKPLEDGSDYAVSVVDQAGVQVTSWGYNLHTWQLLGSELKGYIPDAWQYFDPQNKNRDSHLDLIMLTHGWTAYDWSRLTSTDLSRVVPAEKGLTLRGQYYRRMTSNELGKIGKTTIRLHDNSPFVLYVPQDTLIAAYPITTDSIGRFSADIEEFYGRKVLALSPGGSTIRTANTFDAFSLDRYFSPSPRILPYWERNTGSSFVQEEVVDSIKKITPLEYQLSTLDVKDKKILSHYIRKPISELRLDYMEEWEYAMDVTFRYGVFDFTRYFSTQDYQEYYVVFQQNSYDENNPQLLYDNGDDYFRNLSNTDISADENVADYFAYDERSGNRGPGYYIYRDHLPRYRNTITVSNVIQSIFARYNLHWCYWVMPAVIEGEYCKDSLPVIDEDYLHGRDVWKMTNFSEIILSSARKHCEMFHGGEGFWNPKAEIRDGSVFLGPFWNKKPYSFLYDGFYTMKTIYPTGNEISTESKTFIERLKGTGAQSLSPGFLKENVLTPNYVAFLVQASKDTTNTQLKVDLCNEAGSRRYTSLRGYTRSKQFYSPDYSTMKPDGRDYRRTLLWNPMLKSAGGKLQFELYNSSECGAIAVDVLGVDDGVVYSNDEHVTTRILDKGSDDEHGINAGGTGRLHVELVADSLAVLREYEYAEIYLRKGRYTKSINIYAELVQYGYVPAIYRVGYCYRHGLGIMKSARHALRFLAQAAEAGYAAAQYEYAMMHLGGEGVEASPTVAVHWLRESAAQGYDDARVQLAKCLLGAVGVPADSITAGELLREASLDGHSEGLYLYALHMQDTGMVDDPLLGTPVDCIKASAAKEYPDALYALIQHYESLGDYDNVYVTARRLHQLGDRRGTKVVADCYLHGRGVKRDKSLAKDLYREAESGE